MNQLISIVIPIFFLMDFIGTIPVFVSLTKDYRQNERLKTAILSSLIACTIVLFFAVLGEYIMQYFGLSIAALQVGGGLLLMYIAFEMIFCGQAAYQDVDNKNIIVSPLAIPMLAGPGSMSFAMISFIQLQGSEKFLIPMAMVMVFILGASLLACSSWLNRILGKEFVRGLEKVTAVLLAVIASEMILKGIKMYFF
jgi:multiple antibiotic resistance protein